MVSKRLPVGQLLVLVLLAFYLDLTNALATRPRVIELVLGIVFGAGVMVGMIQLYSEQTRTDSIPASRGHLMRY
jgi:hypothetical protein